MLLHLYTLFYTLYVRFKYVLERNRKTSKMLHMSKMASSASPVTKVVATSLQRRALNQYATAALRARSNSSTRHHARALSAATSALKQVDLVCQALNCRCDVCVFLKLTQVCLQMAVYVLAGM